MIDVGFMCVSVRGKVLVINVTNLYRRDRARRNLDLVNCDGSTGNAGYCSIHRGTQSLEGGLYKPKKVWLWFCLL